MHQEAKQEEDQLARAQEEALQTKQRADAVAEVEMESRRQLQELQEQREQMIKEVAETLCVAGKCC